jgi:hypothetical protein
MNNWIIYLTFVGLTACNFSKESEKGVPRNILDFDLVPSEILRLAIDDSTSLKTYNLSCHNTDSVELLLVENRIKNSIDYYDIDNSKYLFSLKLPVEGPNAIDIRGFSVVGHDSLLAFSKNTFRGSLLVNTKGEILKRYAFNSYHNEGITNHASYTRMPDFYFDNKGYSLIVPLRDFRDPSMFNDTFLEMKVDFRAEELSFLPIGYPESYKDHTWSMSHAIPSRIMNDKHEFVYSFGIEPNIYVYDIEGNLILTKYAASEMAEVIEPFDKSSPASKENLMYLLENTFYSDIFYDKYRKVYYRFVKHPIKEETIMWEDKPISIVILDENYDKIGETLLPRNLYYARDIFVSKSGLMISNNHQKNPDIDENFMSFTRFDLVEANNN